jgi:lipopolysaccharide export system ATP-binding protein
VTNPKLVLLDEPFSGVDPIAVEDLQREVHNASTASTASRC